MNIIINNIKGSYYLRLNINLLR